MSAKANTQGRTFNLGVDSAGRLIFLKFGDNRRWSLRRLGEAPVEIELTVEQLAEIARLAGK